MTKIPSVEERVDEIFNVYSQVDNEYNMYLINAGEAQQKAKSKCSAILTADRTALLTELKEWSEEEPTINGMMLKARLLARIDELINPLEIRRKLGK